MIEPPSRPLLSTLTELDLCTPRDVRRCRRRVRRLARDVPAFDSVWIDALLQLRRLTPFQARLLESPRPQRLNVGPCVLLDALGHGRIARTYLARRRAGRERCVVKTFEGPPEWLGWALPRVQATVEGLTDFAHPSVVAPHACLRERNLLVTVSRFVPGLTLEELLIRRGRFPVPVVLDLAGQLIDALAALEERGGLHGDIRLRNVRLTNGGIAALVDAGIAPAVQPELTIHAGLPPDRYDGTA
ncbi:MAG: protein kinase, partial [Planctomycetaceae bacterium]